MRFVDKYDKVMTKNLTKGFVDHRGFGLTPQTITELAFNHAERGFDIRPLVVVLQEFFVPKLKVVKHLGPDSASPSSVADPERDIRRGSDACYSLKIRFRGVTFIRRHFGNLKVLSGCIHQDRQELSIMCVAVENLYRRHDVSLNAAHNVALHPIMLLCDRTIFVVKPAGEMASSEARGIHRKVYFDRFQGQATLSNQVFKERRQLGILKIVGNAIEVRNLGNESALVRLSQIGHEPALRNSGIDFERDSENGVREGQRWTAILDRRCDKARAKIGQQNLESVLLVSLRLIVRAPILRIGSALSLRDSETFGNRGTSIRVLFALHHKGCRIHMLALDSACFMVRTSASSDGRYDIDLIQSPIACLGRDKPDVALPANLPGCCQFQAALFSQVHDILASLVNILLARYICVKRFFQFSVDFIFLSGILLSSWQWSRLNKRVIDVAAARTNGFREQARTASREFVPSVNRRTGTNLERTNERRHKDLLSKNLAERGGFEPPTRGLAWRPSAGALASKANPLPSSGISPLNGVGGEGASQTFTPHLHHKKSFPPFLFLFSTATHMIQDSTWG